MNRKQILATLAVVVLAASAGCAGIFGGDTASTPDSTDTPTDGTPTDGTPTDGTPTDGTPTDGPPENDSDGNDSELPSVSEFNYPDAASADGVQSSLVEIHQTRLSSASSVMVETSDTTAVQGDEIVVSDVVKYSGDKVYSQKSRTQSTQEIWSNDERTSVVRESNDQLTRYYESPPVPVASSTFGNSNIETLISNGEFEATEVVEMNGEPVVKYESTNIDADAIATPVFRADGAQDATATLYVSSNGLIHNYKINATVSQFGSDRAKTLNSTLSGVDSTDVSEPGWVSENQDQIVSMSSTSTDSYFSLTMERGESIPSDAQVMVLSGGQTELTLSDSFDQGDTLYIYSENGELKNSFTEPTGDTQSPGSSTYAVFSVGDGPGVLAYQYTG